MFGWIKTAKKLFTGDDADASLVRIKDDGFMSENIAVSIEDIIRDEENDDIGKLHVLSLTEFHQVLGETWDAREEKIFLLTEAVMRSRVGEGNKWEHQSKEIYIMLFPALNAMEADARAYEIAEEVGMKIIGERFDGTRRPFARIAGVDPKDALNKDGTLNIEALEKAGREGQSAGNEKAIKPGQDETKTQAKGPDWQKKNHEHEDAKTDWHKNSHQSGEHDTNWNAQHHAHTETNTNWQERHHKTGPGINPNWRDMDQTEKKNDTGPQWVSMDKKKDTSPCQASPAPKSTSKYEVSFSPCWDRTTQSLHIYKALLVYNAPNGQRFEGAKAYSGHKTAEQRFKVDCWLLQNTAKALFPLANKRVKTPVFIPFQSSSLRADLKEKFFENLAQFNPDLRRGYFIIELLDDAQWDEDELKATLSQLKQLVCGVAFRPHPHKNFKPPASGEFDWIGVDLSELDEESGISPERLNELHKETATYNAKSYIFGLNKRSQIKDMLQIGSELISGVALVRSTHKLRPPFDLPIERLLK